LLLQAELIELLASANKEK